MHTGTDSYCNLIICSILISLKIKPGRKADVLTTANGVLFKSHMIHC